MTKRIVAMGGGGYLMEPNNPLLDDFVLSLARGAESRVCLLPTAAGDSDRMLAMFYTYLGPRCKATHLALFNRRVDDVDAFLRAQDIVFVSGGNTANMLAVWRVHGVDAALRRAYEAGVIMAGVSAGALCWFGGGVTDSFGALARLDDGLAFLDGSMCPHYDGEAERRPTYHTLVADGMPAGWAADDGCALHFVDGALREAVSSRPHARGYRVKRAPDGAVVETPLPTRYLETR
jgi:peptidase E